MIYTDDLLADTAVFTSDPMAVGNADEIYGTVYSDQDATFTVEFAWAHAPTTWDAIASETYASGSKNGYRYPIYGDWVRVVFTNGAVTQTEFRLTFKHRLLGRK